MKRRRAFISYGLSWYSLRSQLVFLTASAGIPYGLSWYSLRSQLVFLTASAGIPYGLSWYSLRSQLPTLVYLTVWAGIPYGLGLCSLRFQLVSLTVSAGIPYDLSWYSLRFPLIFLTVSAGIRHLFMRQISSANCNNIPTTFHTMSWCKIYCSLLWYELHAVWSLPNNCPVNSWRHLVMSWLRLHQFHNSIIPEYHYEKTNYTQYWVKVL